MRPGAQRRAPAPKPRIATFRIAGIFALLAHTRRAQIHRPTFAQMCDPALRRDGKAPEIPSMASMADVDGAVVPPALWLHGDRGIYLVSNAQDRRNVQPLYSLESNGNIEPIERWFPEKMRIFGKTDGIELLQADAIEGLLTQSGVSAPNGSFLCVEFKGEGGSGQLNAWVTGGSS